MTTPGADPHLILDLIEAFRRSKALFAAVELGIFDRLASGPATARNLAQDGNEAALERLLDACVSLGLLERTEGGYANSEVAARFLRRDSPHSLTGYILYSNEALFPMWGRLEEAVREGTNRWESTFGPGRDLFAHFFRTPEARRDFLSGMHGLGKLSSPAVAAAFDLSAFHAMTDLGGASGHLAAAVKARYPAMEVSVFDLPAAVRFAQEQFRQPGLTWTAGNFFTDPLPRSDLFAMGRILHDWGAGKVRRLLARVYDALPARGGLLLAEMLLDDDHRGPAPAHMQSLNMLVCTEGKERSLAEYRTLLQEAGFVDIHGKRTGTPLDAVLARKP